MISLYNELSVFEKDFHSRYANQLAIKDQTIWVNDTATVFVKRVVT